MDICEENTKRGSLFLETQITSEQTEQRETEGSRCFWLPGHSVSGRHTVHLSLDTLFLGPNVGQSCREGMHSVPGEGSAVETEVQLTLWSFEELPAERQGQSAVREGGP